jgi:hypothetical protein
MDSLLFPPVAAMDGSTLRLGDAVTAPTDAVRESVDKFPDRTERSLYLDWPLDAAPARVLAAGLRLRVSATARVSVPMARVLPAQPAAALLTCPRLFPPDDATVDGQFAVALTAPDCLSGTIHLAEDDAGVAATPAPLDCPVQLYLYGEDEALIIEHEFQREAWARPGETLLLARQVLHRLSATDAHPLAVTGAYLADAGCAPPPDRAAWAREAIVWEVEPFSLGGWAGITAQLDHIRALGFNTLYLMPWHQGSYGTIDYLQMDERLGDFAGLRALCDAAHARGLRVLFDLLVNIAVPESPYLQAHPDWFYHDADGQVLTHPLWGGACLDPASPGFRAFLTDYAVRCCTDWGADGFRVDAVSYRGGAWHASLGLQPYAHSHAVFTLLHEIRAALRRVHPDAVLMSETFGPMQAPWSDLVCGHWIIGMDWLQQGLLGGTIDGATLQRLLADHFAVLPPQTWLALYTHTHDTLAFTKRDEHGPALDALFSHLALVGAGVMAFGGGWGMPRRPQPAEEADYQRLFACKTALGGVAVGEVDFPPTDTPALCVAVRPSARGLVRVVTNFSALPHPLPAGQVLYSRLGSGNGVIAGWDTAVQTG